MALISAADLAARLNDGRVRIFDVRWYLSRPGAGAEAYQAGHIPTAVFLDLDDDLSDPSGFGAPGRHPLPSPAAFRDRMMMAGVGTNDLVVAYDDSGGTTAARLWWMLDNLGHRGGAAVLDGGIQAWTANGQPTTTAVPATPPATELDLADQWTNVVDRDALAARLGQVTLLDARAGDRYRGEVEPIDPVAGHIPTAMSMPTGDNLDVDGRFLPTDQLRSRFGDAASGGRAIVYCGSGANACHNILAARVAGLPDPMLYVGSFSDWSRSNMPIATGAEPGAPR